MTTMTVHEVMSTSPVTATPTSSVVDLLALFDRHDYNAFPVLDQQDRLLGIVSKLDVLRLFLADRAPPAPAPTAIGTARVADLMRYAVISVEPQDPLVVAADLMVETKLHSLPVVDRRGGLPALVGVVSRGDVLRGLRFQLVESQYLPHDPTS